jgi:hypothetical protein
MLSYRRLLILVALLPVLVAAGTWFIGEQIEVAVLRTFYADGQGHDTKLWVVDHEGRLWLRGGRHHLGWLDRIRHNPRVELTRDGITEEYVAVIEEEPETKRAINQAMAEKYGWIDRWYEILMRYDPVPIRLEPAPGPG